MPSFFLYLVGIGESAQVWKTYFKNPYEKEFLLSNLSSLLCKLKKAKIKKRQYTRFSLLVYEMFTHRAVIFGWFEFSSEQEV